MLTTFRNIKKEYECIVIGGGFYGCIVAEQLARSGKTVLLIEKEPDLMQRASYVNQARIHQGYHYPRSILTSLRSRVNFPRFIDDYADCVYDEFYQFYAIGKISTKVTASQFRLFCERIDAPIKNAPIAVKKLFNKNLVEDVFEVKEYAFDAEKLKHIMWDKLDKASVSMLLQSSAKKILTVDNKLMVEVDIKGESMMVSAGNVFNCGYSKINQVLKQSGLPLIPLKHELTEMALIEMPDLLKRLSVTVMDGPFFSIMPFPSRNLHTLSHVRYTPHYYWQDGEENNFNGYDCRKEISAASHQKHMILDAQRYLPSLQECRYVESLWEVKTVLPQSEVDDSRPILFKQSEEIPGLTSIMGGKIDNIYDVKERLAEVTH